LEVFNTKLDKLWTT